MDANAAGRDLSSGCAALGRVLQRWPDSGGFNLSSGDHSHTDKRCNSVGRPHDNFVGAVILDRSVTFDCVPN